MSLLFRALLRGSSYLNSRLYTTKNSNSFSVLKSGFTSTTKISFRKFGIDISGVNDIQRKRVGYWLFLCAGMCYGAVAVGGLTRLTESGLSMVNWDLFRSMRPPLSQKGWDKEFERYKIKSSSEEMTMAQFNSSGTWGTVIVCGYRFSSCHASTFGHAGISRSTMKRRMLIAAALMLGQGGIGWWIVKSGLDPSKNSEASVPRVSQYRLATHLTIAFLLYSLFIYNAISHFGRPQAQIAKLPNFGLLRGLSHSSKTLVITAFMGAIVAGLDAGLVYNSWPKYADSWIPENLHSRKPIWRNILKTMSPRSLYIATWLASHNFLSTTSDDQANLTLLTITAAWLVSCRMGLYRRAKIALHSTMAMGYIQAALGVYTLLYYVPVWLGSLHKCGSIALLSFELWLTNELRRVPK